VKDIQQFGNAFIAASLYVLKLALVRVVISDGIAMHYSGISLVTD